MKNSFTNWAELYRYWKYCECSSKLENGSYNPLQYDFLKRKHPKKVVSMTRDNDYGYASFETHRLVINFNGSDDIRDWFNNFRTMKNDRRDVHKGFYLTAKKFRPDVKKIVEDYINSNRNIQIIVCGHSRGGAIAKEIARYITKEFNVPVKLFTYGAPRIGGDEWLEEFLSLPIVYSDVINGNDPVSNVPPKAFGFVDLPNQIVIKQPWTSRLPWRWIKVHLGYEKAIRKQMK